MLVGCFRFRSYWPALFAGVFVMMLVFIPWDIIFTQRGVWSFNHDYVSGPYLWNLPVEEWLFFVVIPYCVVFSYEVIRYFFPGLVFQRASFWVFVGSGLLFLVLALFNTHREYTLMGMMLIVFTVYEKIKGSMRPKLLNSYTPS